MKIYTLTLNPAIDVHAYTDKLKLNKETLLKLRSRDAGGKGLNVSRALFEYGINSTPIILLGKENATEFKSLIGSLSDLTLFIECDGRIRENLTIHSGSDETRLSFEGFFAPKNILSNIESLLNISHGDILTFTGRLPQGISVQDAKDFLHRMKSMGAKIVIDSNSFSLSDVIDISPWLIKPNEEEISKYMGAEITSREDALTMAREIYNKGIENVMISLGSQGAVLKCCDGEYSFLSPKIKAVSTIGAGDSSIAGFISAHREGLCASESLKRAIAFGSSACLTEGSLPPRKKDILSLLNEITARV